MKGRHPNSAAGGALPGTREIRREINNVGVSEYEYFSASLRDGGTVRPVHGEEGAQGRPEAGQIGSISWKRPAAAAPECACGPSF